LIFFTLIVCGPAAAAPNFFSGYAFSLELNTGFFYGQGEEAVYFPGSGRRKSFLTWDMKPLFYYGAALDFSLTEPLEKAGFFGSFSAKFGVPAKTGDMVDEDWDIQRQRIGFSRHDNHTESAVLTDLLLGASIPIKSRLALGLYGGFSWMRFSWTGRDGHGSYSWNPSASFSGPVISYTQEWLLFYPGVSLLVPFFSRFALKFSFQGSPLIFCAARDHHITTSTEYHDRLRWGLYLEPGMELRFIPRKNCVLSLNCAYRLTESGDGDSSSKTTGPGGGNSSELQTSAGAAIRVFTLGLSFKIGLY
ncbi:MAG: omptin family outer membrane protease, partial [Treponema sp.]|nr:omptin family outer membrane protease [Treponema sp.]